MAFFAGPLANPPCSLPHLVALTSHLCPLGHPTPSRQSLFRLKSNPRPPTWLLGGISTGGPENETYAREKGLKPMSLNSSGSILVYGPRTTFPPWSLCLCAEPPPQFFRTPMSQLSPTSPYFVRDRSLFCRYTPPPASSPVSSISAEPRFPTPAVGLLSSSPAGREGRARWTEGNLAHPPPGSPRTGAWVTAWVLIELSALHAALSMVTSDPRRGLRRLRGTDCTYMGAAMLAQARSIECSRETGADENRDDRLEGRPLLRRAVGRRGGLGSCCVSLAVRGGGRAWTLPGFVNGVRCCIKSKMLLFLERASHL